MDGWDNKINKQYINKEVINYDISPMLKTVTQDINIVIIQSKNNCQANINVLPAAYSKSKINIYIFAEDNASVNCVCTLRVPSHIEGVETDIQIRSWPFDESRIQARPEMFIANSNVIAKHGNALGTMDATNKYYLESKGIINFKELIKESLLEYV